MGSYSNVECNHQWLWWGRGKWTRNALCPEEGAGGIYDPHLGIETGSSLGPQEHLRSQRRLVWAKPPWSVESFEGTELKRALHPCCHTGSCSVQCGTLKCLVSNASGLGWLGKLLSRRHCQAITKWEYFIVFRKQGSRSTTVEFLTFEKSTSVPTGTQWCSFTEVFFWELAKFDPQ